MITLSDRAKKEVTRIISDQKLGDVFLRVGVKGGGCSGFSYTLGFDDNKTELDMQYDNVICLVSRRKNDVTTMIIFEALAWTIVGFAILIGIVKWLG